MARLSWPEYALKLAAVAAERSEDPYKKVGACVLRHDNTIASLGYNGAPPGVNIDWSIREERRKKVVHAEINALRYVKPNECYFLACTLSPCYECIRSISSYGIKNVIINEVYELDMSGLELSKEYGINIYASTEALRHMEKENTKYVIPISNF